MTVLFNVIEITFKKIMIFILNYDIHLIFLFLGELQDVVSTKTSDGYDTNDCTPVWLPTNGFVFCLYK